MKSQGTDNFLVRNEISEVISRLTDEQAGQIFKAMIEYNQTGIEPNLDQVLSLVFVPIRQSMDRSADAYKKMCEKNKLNAVKRWKKDVGDATACDRMPSDAKACLPNRNPNRNPNPNPKRNIDITESTSDSSPPQIKADKSSHHKYGEYDNVLLTDDQMDKLKTEYPFDYNKRIERLSEYMASTGKTYKNHLATIRSWAKKERQKQEKESKMNPRIFRGEHEEVRDEDIYEVC